MTPTDQEIDPKELLFDFAGNLETVVGTDMTGFAILQLNKLVTQRPDLVAKLLNPSFVAEVSKFSSDNDDTTLLVLLDPVKISKIRNLIETHKGRKPSFLEMGSILGDLIEIFK